MVLWRLTVHVPGEGVSEFLAFNLHVETNGNQNFCLGGILMDHRRVVVIEAGPPPPPPQEK